MFMWDIIDSVYRKVVLWFGFQLFSVRITWSNLKTKTQIQTILANGQLWWEMLFILGTFIFKFFFFLHAQILNVDRSVSFFVDILLKCLFWVYF